MPDNPKTETIYIDGKRKVLCEGKSRQNAEILRVDLVHCQNMWKYVLEHGVTDPYDTDGGALEAYRRHTVHQLREIEKWCDPADYPPEYHRGVPPEMPRNYIVRKDEIIPNAEKVLAAMDAEPAFEEFRELLDSMPDTQVCEFMHNRNAENARRYARIPYQNRENLRNLLAKDNPLTPREWADLRSYGDRPEYHFDNIRGRLDELKAFLAEDPDNVTFETDENDELDSWVERLSIAAKKPDPGMRAVQLSMF